MLFKLLIKSRRNLQTLSCLTGPNQIPFHKKMVEDTLTEARQLIVWIAHGCENVTPKNKEKKKMYPNQVLPITLSNETVSRPTTRQLHPNGNGFKDRGRTRVPDAQHSSDTAVVTSNHHVNLPIYWPQFSDIKYVTPEIKHTHYWDDSRFWDNHISNCSHF